MSAPPTAAVHEKNATLDRNRSALAARPSAVGPLSFAARGGAGRDVAARRSRSDAGGRGRECAEVQSGVALYQRRCRSRGQRVYRRRGARRARLRLADRPARPAQAVFHHARALPGRDRGNRAVVESGQLPAVSLSDRRGHRRRIHGDQFDDPGIHAGAGARLDRSRHQRHVLGRRGARRGRLAGAARSRPAAGRLGLARVLLHRRGAGAGDSADAHLGARKPALAAHAWRRARRARDRRRHRDALSRRRPRALRRRPHCACGCAPADTRRCARYSTRSSTCTGGARWSACR